MLDLVTHCHDYIEFSSGPRYAAKLAGQLGASLTGLYVAPVMQSPTVWRSQPALAAEYIAFEHEELERARRAGNDFVRWAARDGAGAAHWQLAVGDAGEALVAVGNCNDITVLEHRARAPDDSLANIGKTLLSGACCIVVPQNEANAKPAWQRIAIAWNGSAGAIRAVHGALPVLRLADEILLFSLSSMHGSEANREREFSIERYLESHDLKANWHAMDGTHPTFDQTVLVESSRLAIDLLVMGAFGTTRFDPNRPRGTTPRVLQQSLLPVLLRH